MTAGMDDVPNHRKALLLSTGVFVAAIAAGLLVYGSFHRSATAHASPAPELLSALPPGAPTLVYVDLAAVRASSFYQHRADKGPITLPNQDYADFVRSTGFDYEKDLDRVVVASWPEASANEPRKNMAIAEGRFDRAKIRDYATRKGKLDRQEGHEVFLFHGRDSAAWDSVTFLDDHRIALVEGASIAPLLAPRAAVGADPARERAARVDGAAAFAITRVPPIPDDFAAGKSQSSQLASLARSVQWITLAASPEGDNLRVSLEGECDNSANAIEIRSALELLRMIGRAGLESPKTRQSMDPAALATLQTILSNAEVTQAAGRVRILVELTPDILKLGEKLKVQ